MNALYYFYFGLLYLTTFSVLLAAFQWRESKFGSIGLWIFTVVASWTLIETASAVRLVLFSDRGDTGFVMEGEVAELDPRDLLPRMKRRDAELGYSGRPSFTGRAAKRVGNQYAYDTYYTLDRLGYRITPGNPQQTNETHLFLGDSETFGTGVSDQEAYPSIYANALGRAHVVNAAFEGYGPQHALEILRLRTQVLRSEHPISHVYYMVCCRHDLRIAGYSTWESEKLRFNVDRTGNLEFLGLQKTPVLASWLNRLFTIKLTREALNGWRLRAEPQAARDQLLRLSLIEMKARAERLGANFTLIVHDGSHEKPLPLDITGLKAAGVAMVNVRDLIPANLYENGNFRPLDEHPNAAWHQSLGVALAAHHLKLLRTP